MIAREGPVARLRTHGDRLDAVQGPARALLVDDQLQRLADAVRHHGPGADEDGSRRQARVPPAYGRPAETEQQQTEEHQGALRGRFQYVAQPPRSVRDRPRQRPVRRCGRPPRDLDRIGPAEPSR